MRASILAAFALLGAAAAAFATPNALVAEPPAAVKPATPSNNSDATTGNAPYIAATPNESIARPDLAAPLSSSGVVPAGSMIAGGDLGTLSLPALTIPLPHLITIGIGLDYFRGSDFLFPGSTVQRGALSLGAAYAPLAWLETYGALGFTDANRFGPSSRQTLSSVGDADLGVKLVFPITAIFSAGGLVELDIPSGVGGFSLKGTGGRAAAMASLSGDIGPVPLVGTLLAGYVLDNSYQLLGSIGTFPAYALGLSLYDRVQGGISLQSPLRFVAPSVELEMETPVARGQNLPSSGELLRARLFVGATAIHTGVPGLTASAGIGFSLVRTGRIESDSLPIAGWAPDSPWQALLGFSYAFEARLPQRRTPIWHDEPQEFAPPPHPPARAPLLGQPVANALENNAGTAPLIAAPPIEEGKGRISVLVLDSNSQTPLSGAWVNAIELTDLGAITGADGRANLDAPPGQLTLAIARDGYDPYSDATVVTAGGVRELTVQLQPQLNDATVRGRILDDDDDQPLRASLELVPLAGNAPTAALAELPTFEGTFSLPIPHGAFDLVAHAPGYRAFSIRIEALPGEQVSKDISLQRAPGEPLAKATALRIDFSARVPFVPQRAELLPESLAALGELAKTMQLAGGPMSLGVRIQAAEMPAGEDELTALLLAEERARAIADVLIAKGMPRELLQAHGLGIAHEGQPLLEIKRTAPSPKPPL